MWLLQASISLPLCEPVVLPSSQVKVDHGVRTLVLLIGPVDAAAGLLQGCPGTHRTLLNYDYVWDSLSVPDCIRDPSLSLTVPKTPVPTLGSMWLPHPDSQT